MFRKIIVLTALLVISCFTSGFAQDSRIDKSAQAAADKYLKGMMIADLPEGEQMIAESAWPMWGSKPVLLKHETIFEGMIDTDIPTIKGYKRLIDSQIKSEAGTPLAKRTLLIAYPSTKDNQWRVLVFSTGTNVEKELSYFESKIGNTRFGKDQINYRKVAHWYAAAGRIKDAYRAYKKASDLNKIDPENRITQSDFDIYVETMKQITGIRESDK